MDHGGLVVVVSSLRPAQASSLPGVCSASVSSFVRKQAVGQAGTGMWILSLATRDSAVGASLQTCSDPQRPTSMLDTWLGHPVLPGAVFKPNLLFLPRVPFCLGYSPRWVEAGLCGGERRGIALELGWVR